MTPWHLAFPSETLALTYSSCSHANADKEENTAVTFTSSPPCVTSFYYYFYYYFFITYFTKSPTHKGYVCATVAVRNKGSRPQSFHLRQDTDLPVRETARASLFPFQRDNRRCLQKYSKQGRKERSFFILSTAKYSLEQFWAFTLPIIKLKLNEIIIKNLS